MFSSLQAAYGELAESRFELEQRATEIEESRKIFEQVLDSMSEALFLLDNRGRIERVNDAASALLEIDEAQLLGRPLQVVWPEPGIPTTPWELLERAPAGAFFDLDVEVRRRRAGAVAASVSCAVVRAESRRVAGLLVVARDITARKQSEAALGFLADASRALAESLDYETTLTRVTELAVPALADWCIVSTVDEDGAVRSQAVAHADPSGAALAEVILAGPAIAPDAADGVVKVIRSGKPELSTAVSPDALAAEAREPEGLDAVLASIGPASSICVPLMARARTLGAISLIAAESARRYGPEDLAMAEELARRAAMALDNARLYEMERGIAETLQRSLLPQRLPDIPQIAVAARYRPAETQAVGGDWYDVIELPDGGVGLAMGDVAGHGIPAAAVMGRLRQALRAYALEGHSPAIIAQRLNALVEPDEMATLAYVVLDPLEWTVCYVLAGHPPPLVISPDGATRFLERGSAPLAGLAAPLYVQVSATFEPDSTLLLYTDGLVEVRGEVIDAGLVRLEAAARAASGEEPGQLLDRVLAGTLGKRIATDDVALLAVRAQAADLGHFVLRRPARPSSAPELRRGLRRWLAAAGAQSTEREDIELACGEACANAIEHAYGAAGGEVELEAALRDGEVVITIRDNGLWRASRSVGRGRGMPLMNELMDDVSTQRSRAGTTIVMRRRLSRAPGA